MLILSSASPRRSELLQQAGIAHLVRPARVDETLLPGEVARAYVKRLAREKVLAAALELFPAGSPVPSVADEPRLEYSILGADTAVVVDGEIFGKPADVADAARMLRLLSGREHRVLTGICLLLPRAGVRTPGASHRFHCHVHCESTRVWFAELTTQEIEEYVRSGEPMDKAGAYAIQGLASRYVTRIEGSYSNVVGLPVALVWKMLTGLQEMSS